MSVLAVTMLLALSATVPGVVAGVGTAANEQNPALSSTPSDFVSADSFLNSSQNVSVWERAALPLRVDTGNAATTIEGPATHIYTNETGEAPLDKDTVGVFEPEVPISVEFDSGVGAGTDQFSGQDVQLVAARLAENPDTSGVNSSSLSNLGTAEALDRLLSQNRTVEQVNRNFTFSLADNGTIEDGAVTTTFEADEPGVHALMLVSSESGEAVSVSDGNVSLSEDIEVLGVDAAPVQTDGATATPQSSTVSPGENVTFDVESNLDDEQTSHVVMLFNESVLSEQETTIKFDGDIDTLMDKVLNGSLSGDDVTVEHSITGADGVARIQQGSNVMGISLDDRSTRRTVSFASTVDFIANETNQTAPTTEETDDSEVLNASVTAVVTDGDSATLDVGTSANWTEGTYEYLYIASTNDTNQFSTDKDTLTVSDAEEEDELDEVQLNLTANRTEVTVGQAVGFSVTGDDDPVADAEITLGNQTATTNASGQAVIRPTEAGNYTAEVTKESTDTETYLRDTLDLVIEAEPDDGDGPPAGGGGGQGGGDDGGDANSVATSNGATVNFRSTSGGAPLSVQVPNVASDSSAVTALELTTRFSESNFRVEFTKPQAGPPSGTPALDSSQGTAVSYFTADAIGISADEIEQANFTFTLSEEQLGDRSPDDVRLFRYVDDGWTTLETTHVGGNEFRARSPGFSAFAIGFASQEQVTETATPTEETATPTPVDGTETPTDTATATPAGPGGGGGPGLGTIALILAVLAILGAGVYFQFRDDIDLDDYR